MCVPHVVRTLHSKVYMGGGVDGHSLSMGTTSMCMCVYIAS